MREWPNALYDYDCGKCGSFSDLQPMSRASEAISCPNCGEPADRIVCAPFVANMNSHNRIAHQRNEKSAHEPQVATGPLPGRARGHGAITMATATAVGCSTPMAGPGQSGTRFSHAPTRSGLPVPSENPQRTETGRNGDGPNDRWPLVARIPQAGKAMKAFPFSCISPVSRYRIQRAGEYDSHASPTPEALGPMARRRRKDGATSHRARPAGIIDRNRGLA